jgi:hypothetical protein
MRLATVVVAACVPVSPEATLNAQQPGSRPAAAQPQPASRRTSYTLGISKGAGALTCTFCNDEGKDGIAGMVGIETPFRRAIKLGFEADWWLHSGGGSSRSVFAAMPVFHLYLSPASRAFFKAGLGIGRFTASSDEEELRATALSGVVGVGYEFRLANRSALVPYLSWVRGTGGDMRLNGALVTPYGGLSLLQYGVALSKR